jgi:ribosomal protein S18 acetylase RimI-like enzyme
MECMGWPEGIEARPIEVGDAASLAELRAAAEKVDDEGEHEDADDVLEWLRHPWFDGPRGSIGLWSGTRLIGWAVIWSSPNATDVDRINGIGGVHPDWRRRGLGTGLLAWTDSSARERHHERHADLAAELHMYVGEANPGLRSMLEGAGFTAVRYFVEMKLGLTERSAADAVVPENLRLIAFDQKYDEATRLAHNEAFLDHWGSSPRDPDAWSARTTGSKTFRAEQSHLLLDGEQVASYVLAYEYDADTAATGVRDLYIGQVGTRRLYRGRGAANALLASTLAAAEVAGFETASLGVDSANPTGALGLYERLGFTVTRRSTAYSRPLS